MLWFVRIDHNFAVASEGAINSRQQLLFSIIIAQSVSRPPPS